MHNFDSAFKKVSELVEDFKQNEKRYLSPDYQEAHVRREFIETKIHSEVYKSKIRRGGLYNLTDEEIKIVDGK
jgi:hypothetical protein